MMYLDDAPGVLGYAEALFAQATEEPASYDGVLQICSSLEARGILRFTGFHADGSPKYAVTERGRAILQRAWHRV